MNILQGNFTTIKKTKPSITNQLKFVKTNLLILFWSWNILYNKCDFLEKSELSRERRRSRQKHPIKVKPILNSLSCVFYDQICNELCRTMTFCTTCRLLLQAKEQKSINLFLLCSVDNGLLAFWLPSPTVAYTTWTEKGAYIFLIPYTTSLWLLVSHCICQYFKLFHPYIVCVFTHLPRYINWIKLAHDHGSNLTV